jgi:integrase
VDVRKGVHTAPSTSATVAEAAETWIKRVEADDRERGTLRQYRQHIDLHIVPRLGRVKLAQLSPKVVEDFRDDLLLKLSRPLGRKVLTSFKSILRTSKHAHVADGVSIVRDKRKERRLEVGRNIPTPGEIKRLIAAAKPGRHRALLLVAALCGLRASELRGLRWADIDLKAATLCVTQRADRWGTIGAPKTVSSKREIPLAPPVLSELRAWKLACPKTEGDIVFPTRTGHTEDQAGLGRHLQRLMVRAAIVDKAGKPKYAMHALRHFFASWCLNRKPEGRELAPKEVQTLLGHSSIVMTMDVYGHLFPRSGDRTELAEAASALLA